MGGRASRTKGPTSRSARQGTYSSASLQRGRSRPKDRFTDPKGQVAGSHLAPLGRAQSFHVAELTPREDVELAQDAADVSVHRPGTDEQAAPISREVSPDATMRATRNSWAVSVCTPLVGRTDRSPAAPSLMAALVRKTRAPAPENTGVPEYGTRLSVATRPTAGGLGPPAAPHRPGSVPQRPADTTPPAPGRPGAAPACAGTAPRPTAYRTRGRSPEAPRRQTGPTASAHRPRRPRHTPPPAGPDTPHRHRRIAPPRPRAPPPAVPLRCA